MSPTPPGHTLFSWTGGEPATPPGHTPFSWTGGAETAKSTAVASVGSFTPTINLAAAAKLSAPKNWSAFLKPPPSTLSTEQLLALVANPKALDAHLAANSYIEGVTATMKDVSVLKALCPAPTLDHAARWYAHVSAFTDGRIALLPGVFDNLAACTAQGGATKAAPAAAPAAAGKPPAQDHSVAEDPATRDKVIALLSKHIPGKYTVTATRISALLRPACHAPSAPCSRSSD